MSIRLGPSAMPWTSKQREAARRRPCSHPLFLSVLHTSASSPTMIPVTCQRFWGHFAFRRSMSGSSGRSGRSAGGRGSPAQPAGSAAASSRRQIHHFELLHWILWKSELWRRKKVFREFDERSFGSACQLGVATLYRWDRATGGWLP